MSYRNIVSLESKFEIEDLMTSHIPIPHLVNVNASWKCVEHSSMIFLHQNRNVPERQKPDNNRKCFKAVLVSVATGTSLINSNPQAFVLRATVNLCRRKRDFGLNEHRRMCRTTHGQRWLTHICYFTRIRPYKGQSGQWPNVAATSVRALSVLTCLKHRQMSNHWCFASTLN